MDMIQMIHLVAKSKPQNITLLDSDFILRFIKN